MTLLIISFVAGVLTVLTPCVLPLLPVVFGSSVSGRGRVSVYVVVASLGLSVILFTYLLKVSIALITIPQKFWTYLSGGIIFFFGLTLLFPNLWGGIPGTNKLFTSSNKLLGEGYKKKTIWGDALMGTALGPVFSSCSPTYFVILASVLPASFALGTAYLISYTVGLSLMLLLVAILGERFIARLSGFSDPKSKFKRWLGLIFIILGFLIASGYEKKLEVALLNNGYFDFTKLETKLLRLTDSAEQQIPISTGVVPPLSISSSTEPQISSTPRKGISYREITRPAGFVNTNEVPVRISDYVGEKIILLDIMTYSCINCQRTFPYLVSWYERYKDDGFVIIGIHTPEFAFERDKKNVEKAMRGFGITYPVVLDNEYGTWNAYGNRYWPRKYLIDIHGNVVYDHIGEGAYEETEKLIQELLAERSEVLGARKSTDMEGELVSATIPKQITTAKSPETYFGSFRNNFLGNGLRGVLGEQNLTVSSQVLPNVLYLGGTWNITGEYAESVKNAKVVYRYNATEVYIVASADSSVELEIWQDGKLVTTEAGVDVKNGIVVIQESRLYKLIKNPSSGEHTLELRVRGGAVSLFAFTFG